MTRIFIQFDGSNFYNKLKKMFPTRHISYFQYQNFCHFLTLGATYKAMYYIGEIKRSTSPGKTKQLFDNQQRLFFHLRQQHITLKLGYLLKIQDKYHEKGVDVQIAVDMAVGAVRNDYDRIYLISSDTDLLPAIHIAKKTGKRVVYVGFTGNISHALRKECTDFLLLSRQDLEKFL